MGEESDFCGDRLAALLSPVIDADIVERWLEQVEVDQIGAARRQPVESIEQTIDDSFRREHGVYLTPTPLADALAAGIDAAPGDVVMDLSAGAASLLAAVVRRYPDARVVGVEKEAHLALAAAIHLVSQRMAQGQSAASGDRIFVGDGLARDERWAELEGRAAAVVGNPPYVREKGNRARFEQLRAQHEHLSEFFGARMDLQYLFFHRSASFVRAGGAMAMLTTAYWMSATNARKVRRDLTTRLVPEVLVRLEKTGAFADAPGQHSLLSFFRRPDEPSGPAGPASQRVRAVSLDEQPDDWPELIEALRAPGLERAEVCEHPSAHFGEESWSPFADRATVAWGERLEEAGTRLRDLVDDRQGFVSGADRFSSRHPKRYAEGAQLPERGEPIFLFERDEIPDELANLEATVLRPVLRASELEANSIVLTPPASPLALYIDDELDADGEALIETHLGRFRPVLEHRREVRKGSMPWYRLHWPRDRAEQVGPKLVVPRRAPAPCFALDLSASAISSDCTYLVAPEGVERPLEYLITLMVALNSDVVARYLRHFGKAKGRQLEFYSEPLRSLPLPLRCVDGHLEWVDGLADAALRERCEQLVDGRRMVVTVAQDTEDDSQEKRRPEVGDDGARHVLLVDDNMDTCNALEMLLELNGCSAVTCQCGADALELAKSEAPDVVVLDLGLPDITGYELVRKLREFEALEQATFIALSGRSEPEDIERSLESGFDHHLVKPASAQALLALFPG